MKDEELKHLLSENLKAPSPQLNDRVLSAIPVKTKVKSSYQPMDESLILGMGIAGLLILALAFLFNSLLASTGLLLLLVVVFSLPLFIICLNLITRKRIGQNTSIA